MLFIIDVSVKYQLQREEKQLQDRWRVKKLVLKWWQMYISRFQSGKVKACTVVRILLYRFCLHGIKLAPVALALQYSRQKIRDYWEVSMSKTSSAFKKYIFSTCLSTLRWNQMCSSGVSPILICMKKNIPLVYWWLICMSALTHLWFCLLLGPASLWLTLHICCEYTRHLQVHAGSTSLSSWLIQRASRITMLVHKSVWSWPKSTEITATVCLSSQGPDCGLCWNHRLAMVKFVLGSTWTELHPTRSDTSDHSFWLARGQAHTNRGIVTSPTEQVLLWNINECTSGGVHV